MTVDSKSRPIVDWSAISRATNSVLANPKWIGGGVLFLAIFLLERFFAQNSAFSAQPNVVSQSLIGLINSVAITILASCLQRTYLRSLRGETPKFRELFQTGTSEFSLIALAILLYLPAFGSLFLVRSAIAKGSTMDYIFMPLARDALAGLIVAPFVFSQIFVVDQGDDFIKALRRSSRLVMSAPMAMLSFLFVNCFFGALGAILCGVGLAITLPIQYFALCHVYEDNRLAGQLN